MPTGSRALWLVLAAVLLGVAVADSNDGNGQVARLDEGLGEGRRGAGSVLIRRMTGLTTGGVLRTAGEFSFQGNHEEQTLGEEGGSTVPNSIPRLEDIGESVRATALAAGDSLSPKTLSAISSMVTKEVTKQVGQYCSRVARGQPSSASAAPSAETPSWQGSFNVTHATEEPATDGKVEKTTGFRGGATEGDKWKGGKCITQIPVMVTARKGGKPRLTRSGSQCTSCKPGTYLQIMTHKTMAGKCKAFEPHPQLHCVPIGSNLLQNNWADGDRLCTKGAMMKQVLRVNALDDAKAQKHFAPLAEGSKYKSMEAYCQAWKQMVCQGRTCRVKKDVKCVKVCRYIGRLEREKRFPIKNLPFEMKGKQKGKLALSKKLNNLLKYAYDKKSYENWQQCSPKYCEGDKGRYGAMACSETAMAF